MMPALIRHTVREQVEAATARLAAAGVPTPRADAEWLLAGLRGVGRGALALSFAETMDGVQADRYERAVRRRERREPLQHILGWEEFRGLRFALTPAVMIPRPETELLVDWALALLPPAAGGRRLAIDVGAGSGCIACGLARARGDVRVIAVEASPAAAAIATANVTRLRLTGQVTVAVSDLFSGLRPTRVDLIVANPPYLPTSTLGDLSPEVIDHEPRLALDGGERGLRIIRRIVADAPAWLKPAGVLVMETAGGEQAHDTAQLFSTAGLTDVALRGDLAGVERFVAGRMPEAR